jgi:hypothetical protein
MQMSTIAFDTRLQQFALGRFQRATEKRRLKAEQIDRLYPAGLPDNRIGETCRLYLRLLDRAIYSMYLDCLDAGVGEEGRELLGDLRQPDPSSR